jgi:hypothetical protein
VSEKLFLGVLYAMGFIGLAGTTMTWLRLWQLFGQRRLLRYWTRGTGGRSAVILGSAVCLALLFAWWETVSKLFGCLTDAPCGPNRGAGWITLAAFGAVYLVFEVGLLSLRAPKHGGT